MMKSLTATRSCGAAVLLHVLAVSVLFPTHASAFLSDEQPEGAYGGYELGAIAAEAADHDPSEASSSSYYGDDDAARVHGKGTGKGKGKGGKGMGMGNPSVSGGDGECNICGDSADSKGGKINSLTFRWDATVPGTTANIQADGVSSTIAHLTVADGEEVTFEPDRGYFRADTGFDINDELVNLHTSCSQPIYRDMVVTWSFGTLTVTAFESTMRDGMPWSSDECCNVPVFAECLDACGPFSVNNVICVAACTTACTDAAGADVAANAECDDVLADYSAGQNVAAVCDPTTTTSPPTTTTAEPGCNICGSTPNAKGGKIQSLTFEWTASVFGSTATITVADQKEGPIATVPAQGTPIPDGGTFVITGAGSKLKANTEFTLNGVQVTLHTSCSQPIFVGLSVAFPGEGTLAITGFASTAKDGTVRTDVSCDSEDEEPGCNLCGDTPDARGGKLQALTFLWTAATEGVAATVEAEQKGKKKKKQGEITVTPAGFAAVPDGSEVEIATDGEKFAANTWITVNGVDVTFHTSCSKPIYLGLVLPFDGVGTLTIVGFESTSKHGQQRSEASCDGGTPECRQPGDPPFDRNCNVCSTESSSLPFSKGKKGKGKKGKKAKLESIELEYTGTNCIGGSCNSQNDAKTSVQGDPEGATDVQITVIGGQTFQNVQIGDTFTIETVPHPATLLSITDNAGSVLSIIEFHTSCSAPLFHGDQFGALRLFGFETTGGIIEEDKCDVPPICTTTTEAPPTNPPCDACGGAQGAAITMLRFQIVAGANDVSPNDQEGSATVTGINPGVPPTPMPTSAPDADKRCHATHLGPDESIWLMEHEGCAPWASRLVCTNDANEVLQTTHSRFSSLQNVLSVDTQHWNNLPGSSSAPYIVDGGYVVVHNNGLPLGDKVTCEIQSPEHYCFAFAHDGDNVLPYTHLVDLSDDAADPPVFPGRPITDLWATATSVFPGCASSRTDAAALDGCICVPESQTDLGELGTGFASGSPYPCGSDPGGFAVDPFCDLQGVEGATGTFADINSDGAFGQKIEIDTSCQAGGSKTLNIDDRFGMFKLVGFANDDGRNDMECDACPCNDQSRKVCQGPRTDASDTDSLEFRTICFMEKTNAANEFECKGDGCVASDPVECICGTAPGKGAKAQEYCLFADGEFNGLFADFKSRDASLFFSRNGPFEDVGAFEGGLVDTDPVADSTPCCDHYWYTCAILQDVGSSTSSTPRTGNFDYLAAGVSPADTAVENLKAALENIGVDMVETEVIDIDGTVDDDTCQVMLDADFGLQSDSNFILQRPLPGTQEGDPGSNEVVSCYVDGTIELYCNEPGTYLVDFNSDQAEYVDPSTGNTVCVDPVGQLASDPGGCLPVTRKYCCGADGLIRGRVNPFDYDKVEILTSTACDLPVEDPGPPIPVVVGPSWSWSNWFDLADFLEAAGPGNAGNFPKGRFYGLGFGSAAIVFGIAVAAYAHQRSKLTERRNVTTHPSSSSAPSSAPTRDVYDFESSCGESVTTEQNNSAGMAAAAVAVEAANMQWESEPATARRIAAGLVNRAAAANIASIAAAESAGADQTSDQTSALAGRPQLSGASSEENEIAGQQLQHSPSGSVVSII